VAEAAAAEVMVVVVAAAAATVAVEVMVRAAAAAAAAATAVVVAAAVAAVGRLLFRLQVTLLLSQSSPYEIPAVATLARWIRHTESDRVNDPVS
jgi:hypothetical protein